MIPDTIIIDSLRLLGVKACILGLPAEGVNPLVITLVTPSDNIVLWTILKLFLSQFQTSFDFDLLHAAVFGLSLDIIGGLEETLMRIVCFQAWVTNRSFTLPNITDFDHFFRLTLGEKRAKSFYLCRANVHLLTCSHAKRNLYKHQKRLLRSMIVPYISTFVYWSNLSAASHSSYHFSRSDRRPASSLSLHRQLQRFRVSIRCWWCVRAGPRNVTSLWSFWRRLIDP